MGPFSELFFEDSNLVIINNNKTRHFCISIVEISR